MYIDVLVELKAKNINQTFTYIAKDDMKVQVGSRVLVPFGKQHLEGFVLKVYNQKKVDFELKEIEKVIDIEPVLNEELLQLGKYMSKKTLSNLINCYQTMLPSALKAKNKPHINKKMVTYIELNVPYDHAIKMCKSDAQIRIIEVLKELKPKSELTKISISALNTLLKNNIIKEVKKEEYRLKNNILNQVEDLKLNLEQLNVYNKIIKSLNTFKPFLIHGVTGSGKTEVYIHLIKEVIRKNKTAIILVPEISLTPQLVNNFKTRFKEDIAILHSGLSIGEKYDEWRKIIRKEVKIVIGARSAIFAPLENLGIIIIDEEHSETYKQENTPKYNTVDVALYRSKYHNCPLVLGSATPLIESYARSKVGVYELCEIKNRVNKNMPIVTLVDMKEEIKKGHPIISRLLKEKIKEKLLNNEQVIILLNRRGYTTVTTCKNCGFVYKCPNCDIPLTYHKKTNICQCHYCNYQSIKIDTCPNCHSKDLGDTGMGTEKLVEYIQNNFHNAKVIRMDNDTTKLKGSHERIINDFKEKKYNILIGTQMIAKGLDFEDVTLVGVINGDASLNVPDFRNSERTFQLLTQVAGRSGRSSKKGEVIIQAFNIDHYSLVCASKHDYKSFYLEETKIRKILKYSPYYNLCLIKVNHSDFDLAYNEASKIVTYLKNLNLEDTHILGPGSSAIPRINNIYSVQIVIKFKKLENLYKSLEFLNEQYRKSKVNVDIDLSPIRMC